MTAPINYLTPVERAFIAATVEAARLRVARGDTGKSDEERRASKVAGETYSALLASYGIAKPVREDRVSPKAREAGEGRERRAREEAGLPVASSDVARGARRE